jgi:nitrogen PTS system EIIA component
MNEDSLMGIKEIATYLKINQATAYHWAQAGRLPGIKIGRIWRFREDDINTWLDENMRRARPPLDAQIGAGATNARDLDACDNL